MKVKLYIVWRAAPPPNEKLWLRICWNKGLETGHDCSLCVVRSRSCRSHNLCNWKASLNYPTVIRKYFSHTGSPPCPLTFVYSPTACLFPSRVEPTAILSTLRGMLRHVVARDATYRRCWLGRNFSTSPLPFHVIPFILSGITISLPPLRLLLSSHCASFRGHTVRQ